MKTLPVALLTLPSAAPPAARRGAQGGEPSAPEEVAQPLPGLLLEALGRILGLGLTRRCAGLAGRRLGRDRGSERPAEHHSPGLPQDRGRHRARVQAGDGGAGEGAGQAEAHRDGGARLRRAAGMEKGSAFPSEIPSAFDSLLARAKGSASATGPARRLGPGACCK